MSTGPHIGKIAADLCHIAQRCVSKPLSRLLGPALLSAFVFATTASAEPQILVTDAWIRATVPAQQSTAAFLNIVSNSDATLVGVASPAAKLTELHTMRTIGDIMRMRPIPAGIALPANQEVSLAPGGSHVMLMQLNAPLTDGQFVPVELTIEDQSGARSTVKLEVPVRPITTK